MEHSLLPESFREMWKQWELRLLILLSLSLQLALATQGSRRRNISNYWIQFVLWTTYLLADSVAILTLGVLSNRLANIKENKGTFDPESQITAFWAPFLLLHLGGPDTITAYALADNELWLRQLARLCIQVGVACYIYFMALSGSTLSILAAGIILVGSIKYAERTWCMYLASNSRLRDSMRSLPNFGSIYPRKMEQYNLRREEGYRVRTDEVTQVSAPGHLLVNGGRADREDEAATLVAAYELFKTFKLLFVGLILKSGDLKASRHAFVDNPGMDSQKAFRIVEIELGFMYDLLYTKVPLLNCAWGIVRWVIFISVPCAVLVLFSLQDRKVYPKVDIYITFLLVSLTILAEIYSLLRAVSSDWAEHWRLQRPRRSVISPTIDFPQVWPEQRWGKSVAQFCLLRLSDGIGNRIFHKCPRLAKLEEKAEKRFYVNYKEFKGNIKEWIFKRLKELEREPERRGLASLEDLVSVVLYRSNCEDMVWSVEEMEFDQSILVWHIATELCYYEDHDTMRNGSPDYIASFKMSKLVSRYMLYLLIFHPSMLPTVIGEVRYEDTLVDARKFFNDKEETHVRPDHSCKKHKSRKSMVGEDARRHKHARKFFNDKEELCKYYHLLFEVKTDLPVQKTRADTSTSVLFDGCLLASQFKQADGKWTTISEVWARMLIYSARHCKGQEHCKSLSRGGELLSHVWLLAAHLGVVAQPEQTTRADRITKLITN